MIQGAVDQKPVWDISGAPETLSKGFSHGISVWRVTLCLFKHHNPGTQRQVGGSSGTNTCLRKCWDCNFGKETGTFWNKGWKLGGQWGFYSSLSLASKPGKNSASPSLHSSANPAQILGSHPDTAQSDIIPPQGCFGGSQVYPAIFTILDSFPTSPKPSPFASWAWRRIKSRFIALFLLKLFPSRLVTNQAHQVLVGHISVHQPGNILSTSGSAPLIDWALGPLHSSWTKGRFTDGKSQQQQQQP